MLGDPVSRRVYDRTLDAGSRPEPVEFATPVPPPVPESSFPWRFLIGLAVVGIGIVLLGVFTYQPSNPRTSRHSSRRVRVS